MKLLRFSPLLAIVLPALAEDITPDREAEILREVTVADGFEARVFAVLPETDGPLFLAAAPNGDLYVSGSGVWRLRDTDGDGRANEVKEFAAGVTSPCGLVWDHDRLFLLHPPQLSVLIDTDGDGVADERKVLVEGIGSGNGLSLGIDGWLYIATAGSGFADATGSDGSSVGHHHGGVVRVRPDGSRLELYASGTRNIREVAISPEMEIFARDEAAGDGSWRARFHHFTGLGDHGYPRLYELFPEETVAPVSEHGDGAGSGAVYIDEPGFDDWNNAPFTADRVAGALFKHEVKHRGPTFRQTDEPRKLVSLANPSGAAVDAMGRIYLAGGGAGVIVRVEPDSYAPEPLPDFATTTPAELVQLLESPSYRRRLAAQRELLRRELPEEAIPALVALIADDGRPLNARAAALFLFTSFPEKMEPVREAIAGLGPDPAFDVLAARAFAEIAGALAEKLGGHFPIPRAWRNQPATLVQLNRLVSNSPGWNLATRRAIFDLTLGNSDRLVRHTAVRALAKTADHALALSYIGDPENRPRSEELQEMEDIKAPRHDPDGRARPDALAALARMHEPEAVAGVVRQLGETQDPDFRKALISALCRLHFREGGEEGEPVGIYHRPESWSGTERIAGLLKELLASSPADERTFLREQMARNGLRGDEMPPLE